MSWKPVSQMTQEQREKANAKARAYYSRNKEKSASNNRAWRLANKDRLIEKQKEYRERNKEARKAYQILWREKNRERIIVKDILYRSVNGEIIRERRKDQYWSAPEKDSSRKYFCKLGVSLRVIPVDLRESVERAFKLKRAIRKAKEAKHG